MIVALAALVVSTALPVAPGPDRLIRCEFGRVTNLAAATPAELGLQGKFAVVVLQPDGAVEHAERPAKPLGSAALVQIHDPGHVLAATDVGTVADTWPDQLEFLTRLEDGRRAFITIGNVDPATGRATGSAGVINADGATLAPGQFLQGQCAVEEAPNLATAFAALKETTR